MSMNPFTRTIVISDLTNLHVKTAKPVMGMLCAR